MLNPQLKFCFLNFGILKSNFIVPSFFDILIFCYLEFQVQLCSKYLVHLRLTGLLNVFKKGTFLIYIFFHT